MPVKPLIGIIMGSDSDLPTMKKAVDVCREFDIPFELKILSAHRTPDQHAEWSRTASARGIKVIIAAAGMAAHLPGVTAAQTILPVIGVPMKGKSLEGNDALYSIVQMPPGIPVATVAIDGAKNAAILAVQMLALNDESLANKFLEYRKKMALESINKNNNLEY